MKPNLFYRILAGLTGQRAEQLACKHPQEARDYGLNLLPEENAMDAYEICLNCNKEWHDKGVK